MTVIKRTRLKFFIVMAAIVVAIVAAFCASILVSTHSRNSINTDLILQNTINGFDRPAPQGNNNKPHENRLNEFRGFTVKLNADFEIIESNHNEMVFSQGEITQYVKEIQKLKKTSGEINDLRFLLKNTENGIILTCLDVSMENSIFRQLLTTVLLAGGGGITVLLILVWFLSYWIIKPAAAALEKQKRFISEAGHELKTPLTVISAGVELLQKKPDNSDNDKWLKNIKEQVDKMSAMTTELLTLSKIDEDIKAVKIEFDLAQTVLTESLAFESVAFENGNTLECKIDKGLMYKGNYQAVCGAIGILCDNAVKYACSNNIIEVRLKRQGGKIILSVSNECDTIIKDEISLFFERFYRGSESRAKTNGTGLGLAILKTIAEQNDWKLDVDVLQNKITFSIVF